ncbi:MAG TPA: DUF1588 domain-containing protein [Verrucomicrobiae bacterium]|nr:DUF1588 domain-containing protein [Verrucomicrobiae bacterium]
MFAIQKQNRKERFANPGLVALISVLLGGMSFSPESLADIANASSKIPSQTTDARSLFKQYCYDCHGDGMDKGNLALDELLAVDGPGDKHAQWEKAWKIVLHEFMPPTSAERPSDAERKAMTQWIAEKMLGVNPKQPDPGRVTIRRLNRMEYEFTVTDLFGVDLASEENYSSDSGAANLRLRDRLPPDDTAFGFDNIGDFQSLSPALLEKYFDIAEYVVDRVISVKGPRFPMQAVRGDAVKTSKTDEPKRTEQTAEFQVQRPGKYRIEVQFTLGGWFDFGGAYDFAIKVDGHALTQDAIEVGGQRTHRYSPELQLEAGTHRVSLSTVATKPNSKDDLVHLELRPKIRIVGPMVAEAAEYPESHRRIFFNGAPPETQAARRAYAQEILRRVADRAFRRPTDDVTLQRLTDIAVKNPSFEVGVGEALTAILVSPKFLFRAELQPQPNDPKTIHPLDEYALASRLSYLLWLSLPDAELTRLAGQGKLRENLKPQVQRMLADPKAARFFEDFPGQWLRTRNILMTAISRRDGEINPVRGAMKRETEMLFEYIARNDRDMIELVTADYTFVDRPLANYYGIKDFKGDGFQKVQLSPESKRGGILTHGSFLAATSNPNRTSPVKRGLFVLENLLGTQPPPPPANVPALDDAKAEGKMLKTVREQLAAHREDKSCAACHAHFDPIGVVLENYDVIGLWREQEFGEPIKVDETTVTGEKLTSVDDLKKLFAERKSKFYQCVTEKLLTYALGRGLEPADIITVDGIADQMMANYGKFSTLLMALVESPAFQTRRGDDGRLKELPRVALPEPPPPEKRKGMRRRPNATQVEQNTIKEPEAVAASPDSKSRESPQPK